MPSNSTHHLTSCCPCKSCASTGESLGNSRRLPADRWDDSRRWSPFEYPNRRQEVRGGCRTLKPNNFDRIPRKCLALKKRWSLLRNRSMFDHGHCWDQIWLLLCAFCVFCTHNLLIANFSLERRETNSRLIGWKSRINQLTKVCVWVQDKKGSSMASMILEKLSNKI